MSITVQAEDRRQHRRFPVGGTVILNHADRPYQAMVENISMGGLRTSLHRKLPQGAELSIVIPLPGGDTAIVRAEVIRSYIGGVAMHFHWPSDDDRSRLLLKGVLEA